MTLKRMKLMPHHTDRKTIDSLKTRMIGVSGKRQISKRLHKTWNLMISVHNPKIGRDAKDVMQQMSDVTSPTPAPKR